MADRLLPEPACTPLRSRNTIWPNATCEAGDEDEVCNDVATHEDSDGRWCCQHAGCPGRESTEEDSPQGRRAETDPGSGAGGQPEPPVSGRAEAPGSDLPTLTDKSLEDFADAVNRMVQKLLPQARHFAWSFAAVRAAKGWATPWPEGPDDWDLP